MNKVEIAAKAIIQRDDGKVLVLRRNDKNKLWDIPGGRIEFREDPKDGLTREIMEETGLKVKLGAVSAVWSFMTDKDNQKVGFTMRAEYTSGEIHLSDEHCEYKWVEPAELANLKGNKSFSAKIAGFGTNK
ncbi:hypothetical protein FACS189421_11030 [Bacteroidia bacterium]|nr:hypothetical protein FACS189421_11030 [Bacteroidia bacterium]